MICLAPLYFSLAFPQKVEAPQGFRKVNLNQLENARERHWHVRMEGANLRVETEADLRKADSNKRPGSASTIKIRAEDFTYYWPEGEGIKVGDQWLVNADMGEWGGGIYLMSPSTKSYKAISLRNTGPLFQTSKGIFCIQSLTHFMFWYSDLVAVNKLGNNWTSSIITNLHWNPIQYVQDGDHMICLTPEFVTTLDMDGRQFEIFRNQWSNVEFNSIALDTQHRIWVGLSRGLLCLSPGASKYSSTWFMRA